MLEYMDSEEPYSDSHYSDYSGDSYESSLLDDSELDHDAFYFNDQDNKTFQ